MANAKLKQSKNIFNVTCKKYSRKLFESLPQIKNYLRRPPATLLPLDTPKHTHTRRETHTHVYRYKTPTEKNTLVLLEIINKINAKESFCCAMLEDCASGGVAVKYGPTCLRFYVLFALLSPHPPRTFASGHLTSNFLMGVE